MDPPDRGRCVPVPPGGECCECGWSFDRPFIRGQGETPEPHPVLPHGSPKALVSGVCANCGATWNLDAVKCSTCEFVPAMATMYDELAAKKNAVRRSQYLPPLPVRPQPLKTTAEV